MSYNNSATLLFGVGNIELKVSGKVVYYVGFSGKYKVVSVKTNIIQDDEIARATTVDTVKKYASKLLKSFLKKNCINPSNSSEHKEKLQTILNDRLCNKTIKGISIQSVEIENLFFRHVNVELPPVMMFG